MTGRIATLTGPPGSGKTTAGRRAAALLGVDYVSAGELFRAEAAERGLTLAELGRYAEAHPEVDRDLDERMLGLAAPSRLLEGRVTGALLRRRGLPVLDLVVTARDEERYRRLAGRDGLSVAEARARTLAREASERERYRRYYDIDLDAEPADFVVDSTQRPPEAVAEALADFVRAHRGDP